MANGASFTIDMSSPFRSGWKGGLGGPNSGGHGGPDWYIQYGMDLGVADGTEVLAAFSGHVTKFQPHTPSKDSSKVYGAQLFMRSDNDKMGGFYTHITGSPTFSAGQRINRGDRLGKTMRDHLHFALVEIIGGAPGGRYMGVDLYAHFLALRDQAGTTSVTFKQDGLPPVVGSRAAPSVGPILGWLNGWWKVWDGNTYYYFFGPSGVVQYTKTPPRDTSAPPQRADNHGRYTYTPPNQLVVMWNQVPGEAACRETFYNAVPGCRQMNATSNLYSPLVGTRLS
jgi:murein DD-endopeptidase MepM/ murein hydrolase activator NlpD